MALEILWSWEKENPELKYSQKAYGFPVPIELLC